MMKDIGIGSAIAYMTMMMDVEGAIAIFTTMRVIEMTMVMDMTIDDDDDRCREGRPYMRTTFFWESFTIGNRERTVTSDSRHRHITVFP